MTVCFLANPYTWLSDYRKMKIKANAIWDTGATRSAISTTMMEKLGIRSHGCMPCRTAAGMVEALLYNVLIELPSKAARVTEVACPVLADGSSGLENDALIGMDIISEGDFAICGGSLFSFCHPSLPKPVNLKNKAKSANAKPSTVKPIKSLDDYL